LEFPHIYHILEAITDKRVKIDTVSDGVVAHKMYFSAMYRMIALISQGVLQLGGVKQWWSGKNKSTSLHTHRAVARR